MFERNVRRREAAPRNRKYLAEVQRLTGIDEVEHPVCV
jgi:hypothetical protein